MVRRLTPGSIPFLCICAALLCFAAKTDAAQPHGAASYTLREWHEQDGLDSEELAGVVQDKHGYLWVASNSELSRFDGTAFASMHVPYETFSRGLTTLDGDPAVPAMRAGEVRQSGYAVFRDGMWHFAAEERLGGRQPRTLFRAPDGAVWIGCEDGTVLRRQGEETTLFDAPTEAVGKKTPAFAADSAGAVWIVRGNRLSRAQGTLWTDLSPLTNEPELKLGSSSSGGVWAITRSALQRWNGTAFEEAARLPDLAGAHFVQAVQEDAQGFVWIATRSQGLFRVADGEVKHVPASNEDVTSVCQDADGNVWAATNGSGLSRLRPKAHQLFDQSAGLKNNFSYTIAEDTTGAMWLANRDGGMARVKDGVVDLVSHRANWRQFSTMSVYPAPNGWVWMTTGVGVFRTLAEDPQTALRVPTLNQARNVRATFVARNGDYWLTLDVDRVLRWRNDQTVTFGAEAGFDGREVRAIAEDATGRIWLGAAEGRLYRSNGDRFERVSFPGDADCGALQVIRFEPDGSMLVGTTRRGVVIFPGGDPTRPRALDDSRGLPGSNITQLLVDDRDRYWFASRVGIFWVHGAEVRDFASGKTEHVHAILLGKDEGLPYLSCLGLFQPAAWKARDGSLWFATRRGVLRVDPSVMAATTESPPRVSVVSIATDGVAVTPSAALQIQSTVRKLQLRLSALNLSAPESVQVRYRLDNYDSDWTVLGKDRLVTYPRLPPGRYVFNTMSSNGSGSWGHQPAQLTLLVRPPWWQTFWAQAGYLLIFLGAVVAVVRRWSHRRLRTRLERAEQARAIEQERARIARNIHDDVGASLTRISLLTQAAQQENAGPSPTLEKIYDATHAITRSMDEIVWAVNPQHDNTESFIYYIGNSAQNFLGAAGIRCRLEAPSPAPEVALTSQVRHQLFLCCKEALNNVVKHSGATEVLVRIAFEKRSLVLSVADNGRGLAAEKRQGTGGADRIASGNGLRNLRERMAELRGACTVRAQPAGGTVVTFMVPLQPPVPA